MKHGDKTRQRILEAGIKLWLTNPLHVTSRRIAAHVDLKHQAVRYHYSSDARLRDAVAAYAVETGNSPIIVQLIALKHPAVVKLTQTERNRHFKQLQVSG